MLVKLIHTEIKKARHSSTLWFSLIAAGIIPLVLLLVYLIKWEHFVPAAGMNPWDGFVSQSFGTISTFLFPVYVILLIALNAQLEHKNNSWKKLYALPVKPWAVYLSKLLFLSVVVLLALLAFSVLILFSGWFSAVIHPELGFTSYSPDIGEMVMMFLGLYVAVLGIIGIQTLVSMLSRNMILPLGMGILLLIVSGVLVMGWEDSIYNPYAFPQLFQLGNKGMMDIKQWGTFAVPDVISILTYLFIGGLSAFLFARKNIKA